MTRQLASAAALGSTTLLVGVLLAQPAPAPSENESHRVRAVLASLVPANTARPPNADAPPALTVAVAAGCAPSRALVRVLLRRARTTSPRRSGTTGMILLTDHVWPTLDSLARSTGSRIVRVPRLAARLGVTPAASVSGSTTTGISNVLALAAATSRSLAP